MLQLGIARAWVRLSAGRVRLHLHLLLPVAAAALCVFDTGLALRYLLLLASILVHEAGHLAVSLALGAPKAEVRVWPVFAVAWVPKLIGRRQALVALGGPAANLLLTCLCAVPGGRLTWHLADAAPLDFLVTVNFVGFVGNLVPIPPLDGGRVLQALKRPEATPVSSPSDENPKGDRDG